MAHGRGDRKAGGLPDRFYECLGLPPLFLPMSCVNKRASCRQNQNFLRSRFIGWFGLCHLSFMVDHQDSLAWEVPPFFRAQGDKTFDGPPDSSRKISDFQAHQNEPRQSILVQILSLPGINLGHGRRCLRLRPLERDLQGCLRQPPPTDRWRDIPGSFLTCRGLENRLPAGGSSHHSRPGGRGGLF